MPNLTAHLDLGLAIAGKLRNSNVHRYLGSFLLGCTAPDIRVITKEPREETHFSSLHFENIGEGVRMMFQQYPSLSPIKQLNGPTRAFVAGYASHLIADETWVALLFRPYFGNTDVFPDLRWGKFLDRALQLQMDRLALESSNFLRFVQQHLTTAIVDVDVEFIPLDVLAQWSDWVVDMLRRPFTWDRLQRMVWRAYKPGDPDGVQVVEYFLNDVERSIQDIYKCLPEDAIAQFRSKTVNEYLSIMKEHIACA
jgi:hypothetical protein